MSPLEAYKALCKARPDAFRNAESPGITILQDDDERARAEQEIAAGYRAAGYPAGWERCGLYYEDPWIFLVRDIVRFPDGRAHTYHRIILRGGEHGAVILPRLHERYVLLRHFRHGSRSWSWEIPRGGPEPGRSTAELALDELAEEIGARGEAPARLGIIKTNTGILTASMHVYLVELVSLGVGRAEEGIGETRLATLEEIDTMITRGEIVDACTLSALYLARLTGSL